MVNPNPTLGQNLLKIAIGDRIADIEEHGVKDD
jgi:hypothetical protein